MRLLCLSFKAILLFLVIICFANSSIYTLSENKLRSGHRHYKLASLMPSMVHLILFLVLYLWRIGTITSSSDLAWPIAKPNCQTHCGDVSIPYPFGIGPNKDCYLDEWFQIDCNRPTNKSFLRRTKLEVLSISIQGTLQVNNPVTFFGCKAKEFRRLPNLTGSPFLYSQEKNRFTAVSCGFLALLSADKQLHGCWSNCGNSTTNETHHNSCDIGVDCCQATIPPYLSAMSIKIQSRGMGSNCDNYAFLVDQDWFVKNLSNYRAIKNMESVPVVLDWGFASSYNSSLFKFLQEDFLQNLLNIRQNITNSPDVIGNFTRDEHPMMNRSTPNCMVDAISIMNSSSTYYLQRLQCLCPEGFEGNPYLLQPCQDIDECNQDYNPCTSIDEAIQCENSFGGYKCNSNRTGSICEVIYYNGSSICTGPNPFLSRTSRIKTTLLGLAMGVGLLLLLIGAWWVNKLVKKRKSIKRKKMFFKRNGGLLLEQQLLSGEVNIEKIKLFKSDELEKSTNNFHIDRILGHGGQGTVYKGMLPDGRIVAVKQSKLVDESQLSQFINEIVILSQINHRNVVKLLGCCLENDVPLLVYEFIPNGTLSKYIQDEIEAFPLTWEMRLRIATEIAGALSYLHSAASFPIYHRDVKSTNILLDEKYRAKVADFGTSRSVSMDQTHLTTHVHGTFGYLDPEYFRSSQFTEKSDVYSFGVVLVELLIGRKPIHEVTRSQEEEYRSLAAYFITSMEEDKLCDILDARVLKEGSETDIKVIASLARRCLNLNRRNRPTMREVTSELEAIHNERADQKNNGVELVHTKPIENWGSVPSSIGTGSSWDRDGDDPTSSLLELSQLSHKMKTW